MSDKIAYKYDPDSRIYECVEYIQESPLEPGVWLWPPNITEDEPPSVNEDQTVSWLNGVWQINQKSASQYPELPEVDPRESMIASKFQAKAALLNVGLLDEVEAYFSSDNATPVQKLAWKETTNFYRLSQLVINTGYLLGLTDAQLDDLFISAMEIEI